MVHSRLREARRSGKLQRQIELLEAIAEALDAEYEEKSQCGQCGEWFKNVGSHQQHCDGPYTGD